MTEILDLTDQLASVALFGPIGVGKSFVARTILDHDQTKAKFGQNSHFIHFDDPKISLEAFLERLSGVIQTSHITSVEQLRSHLESSPPLILLLDGVDSILDPPATEPDGISEAIEEFGSYDHVCLVTTSRMYPDIRGFHRVEVPTLSEDDAQDAFYDLCNLGRSPAVNSLIARLDFHPLFIDLLASFVRENDWDESALLTAWDNDQASTIRNGYYQKLKDTIEPMLCSPTIQKLGTIARDVLEAIAAFPSGVREHDLKNIFHKIAGVGEVVDVLCKFSLVHRREGSVGMLSPLQFYFLESMLVHAETEEVINVSWGRNCMPAQACMLIPVSLVSRLRSNTFEGLPIYTSGPPSQHRDPSPRRLIHRDSLPIGTGMFSFHPFRGYGASIFEDSPRTHRHSPEGDHPHTGSRIDRPRKRKWIRRLPEFVKKSEYNDNLPELLWIVTDSINPLIGLLALLGRRTAPTILIDVQGPVDAPPIPPPKGQTLSVMSVSPPPLPKHEALHALDVASVYPLKQQASHPQTLPLVPPPKQRISYARVPYDMSSDDDSD